jgi:hypothetical protein
MGRALANRRSLRRLMLITVLIALTGCATEFERRFDEAERLRSEAAAADSEWLETGDLLAQAQQAASRDDLDAAMVLVERARFQAEMAIKQAAREADAWAGRVVK